MRLPVRRLSEFDLPVANPSDETDQLAVALSGGRKGFAGTIVEVRPVTAASGLEGAEVERRLLEMGFVEGAPVEIIHEGVFGRDPIAVKLADRTVALRRREAGAVMVRQAALGAVPAAK
jgi:ferrous iron transport protein A